MNDPIATIAVPTQARPEALGRCLRALEAQTLGERLELLVVCDGAEHEAALAETVGSSPRVRLLTQRRAGPGAARNLAAAEARAPVVCFTDDDCEPRPDWAERLIARLDRGAGAAVGRTENPDRENTLATASQLVVNYLTEHAARAGPVYGAANNVACRADVLRGIPFDPAYSFAGGDRDWCARVAQAGVELVYVPEAVVLHRQQLTLETFWHQHVAYGRGAYRFRRGQGASLRLERPRFYGGLVARGLAEGPAVGALVLLAQAATAVGFAREALARGAASGVEG